METMSRLDIAKANRMELRAGDEDRMGSRLTENVRFFVLAKRLELRIQIRL